MLKKVAKFLVVAMLFVSIFGSNTFTNATQNFGMSTYDKVLGSEPLGWLTRGIKAWFGRNAVGDGSYNTERSRAISDCYVRLTEGKYDSGRLYSKQDGSIRIAETRRLNNPLLTMYTYYGWVYYPGWVE